MINKFKVFNQNGIIVPVDVEFPIDYFKNVENKVFENFYDGSKKGIGWEFENKEIEIVDKETSITGYPTVDHRYVIAIYQGLKGEFVPPSNAVIYNLDGNLHKVLTIPSLHSSNVLKRIEFNKDSNPPIEAAKYEGGLYFSGFDWFMDENGQLINRIQIIYDRDWIEWRELNPEKGEIGEYLGQGRL